MARRSKGGKRRAKRVHRNRTPRRVSRNPASVEVGAWRRYRAYGGYVNRGNF